MSADPAIIGYHAILIEGGVPAREAAHAAFFVTEYGLDSVTGPGCVTFEPSCGNWNCLNPDLQRVSK